MLNVFAYAMVRPETPNSYVGVEGDVISVGELIDHQGDIDVNLPEINELRSFRLIQEEKTGPRRFSWSEIQLHNYARTEMAKARMLVDVVTLLPDSWSLFLKSELIKSPGNSLGYLKVFFSRFVDEKGEYQLSNKKLGYGVLLEVTEQLHKRTLYAEKALIGELSKLEHVSPYARAMLRVLLEGRNSSCYTATGEDRTDLDGDALRKVCAEAYSHYAHKSAPIFGDQFDVDAVRSNSVLAVAVKIFSAVHQPH